MYEVDEKDRVVPLQDVPQSSVGAPLPLVLADEHRIVLAYYLQVRQPGWDGSWIRMVDPVTSDEPIALACFHRVVHMFGPPNDEALSGHPLARRGLSPYGAFEIKDSSWIRKLERMTSVHPNHQPGSYSGLRHVIFTFHDSTFECICSGFDIRKTRGSMENVIPEMVRLLEWDRADS